MENNRFYDTIGGSRIPSPASRRNWIKGAGLAGLSYSADASLNKGRVWVFTKKHLWKLAANHADKASAIPERVGRFFEDRFSVAVENNQAVVENPANQAEVNFSIFSPSVQRWQQKILEWANSHNLSAGIIAILMQKESNGEPEVRGSSREYGLFQVMPDAFKNEQGQITVNPLDPDTNAHAALTIFTSHLQALGNNIFAAFAAYNGGRSAGELMLGRISQEEYIKRVAAYYSSQNLHPGNEHAAAQNKVHTVRQYANEAMQLYEASTQGQTHASCNHCQTPEAFPTVSSNLSSIEIGGYHITDYRAQIKRDYPSMRVYSSEVGTEATYRKGIALHHTVPPPPNCLNPAWQAALNAHATDRRPPYNMIIAPNGAIYQLTDRGVVSFHVPNYPSKGMYRADYFAIALAGNFETTEGCTQSVPESQLGALVSAVIALHKSWGLPTNLIPHSDLRPTKCPGDSVRIILQTLQAHINNML